MKSRARGFALAAGALCLFPALVRADAPPSQYKPYLSSDDLIEDTATGYTWVRDEVSAGPVSPTQIRCRVPSASLPTVRELATLLDNQPKKVLSDGESKDLHIDQNAFPRTQPKPYWTVSVGPNGQIFVIDFGTGEVSMVPNVPASKAFVRCIIRT